MSANRQNRKGFQNLYAEVEAIMAEEEASAEQIQEMVSQKIKNADAQLSNKDRDQFANQLRKIKSLIETELRSESISDELSARLRGLLSEIHNYLPRCVKTF